MLVTDCTKKGHENYMSIYNYKTQVPIHILKVKDSLVLTVRRFCE